MARGQPEGEETYTPRIEPEDLPRKIVPEVRETGEPGLGIAALGAAGAEAGQRKAVADATTYAGTQLAQFRLDSAKNLEDMKGQVQAGDPGDFYGNFLKKYDTAAQKMLDTAEPNPIAHSMISKGVQDFRTTLAMHAMDYEASSRKAYQNDAITTNTQAQLPLVRQHPETADQVGQTLMTQINGSSNSDETKLAMARGMHSSVTENAALGLADQRPGDVYRHLMGQDVGDPALATRLDELRDPGARARVLEAAQRGVVQNFAQGAVSAYRAGGPIAGARAYAAVDDLKFPGTDQQQEAMRDAVRQEIQKGRGELTAEQQQKMGPTILKVEEALRSKDPPADTRGAIWSLYRNNALDAHTAGAYLGGLDAVEAARTDSQAGQAVINKAWNGQVLLDPKDTQTKKDLSDWFDGMVKTNKLVPGSQAWINFAAETAKRTGTIPQPVGFYARSVMVGSQDPQQIMGAVDAIQRVRQASPRGFPYFEDEHQVAGMADSVADLTKGGMDPVSAITIARKNAAEGKGERERFSELWKAARPFGAADTALTSVITQQIKEDPRLATQHWYGDQTPAIPPLMQSQYENLTRERFQFNGGDAAAAEKSAARDIGNGWGLTMMNGAPELVQTPPERNFPGLTTEDIRAGLAKEVADHAEEFQHYDTSTHSLKPFHVKPDEIRIVPGPSTASSGGATWALMHQPMDGSAPEVIFGKAGRPLEYTLPVAPDDYRAVRAKQRAEAVDAAGVRKKQEEEMDKQLEEAREAEERQGIEGR